MDLRCNGQMTPLHVLIKSNVFVKHSENTKLFMCKPNTDKKTKFFNTAELLLERNADCNAQDENKYTPLHHAVYKNNYEAVLLLINLRNIDLNVSF